MWERPLRRDSRDTKVPPTLELSPSGLVVFDEPIYDAVGVFPINARTLDTVDDARPFVIARLNPRECVDAVHHVRFEVDHRTLIEPGCGEIARVNITARAHLGDNVLGVFVRR